MFFKASIEECSPIRNSAEGSPVLYLDYDGVLHPHDVYATKRGIELRAPGHTLFEGAPILAEILRPYPDLKIVLSTSWVVVKGFSFAKRQLPVELSNRVIGATFHKRLMDRYLFLDSCRGDQIASDANRRGAGEWLALDDDIEGWPPFYDHRLVACDSNLGILCPKTQDDLSLVLSVKLRPGRPRPKG